MHTHNQPSHDHAPRDFGRAFLIGITLNIFYVIVEAVCGVWFDSVSLLADAGHNLSDVFGLCLAFFSFRLAKLKPSQRFTYGLGNSTIFASALNGAILLMAVGAITWEAVRRFSHPVDVHGSGVIWVAMIGVVINSLTAMLFVKGRRGDLNIKGAYLHMMADAMVSLGVVVAGGIILWTGWMWVDPLVSLIIAAVILYGTWGLFRDSLMLLAHGVPSHVDVDSVRRFLNQLPGVIAIHDLHVWALSTTQTALTVHLVKPEIEDNDSLLATIAREMLEQFGIDHCTIQIESHSEAFACPLQSDDLV